MDNYEQKFSVVVQEQGCAESLSDNISISFLLRPSSESIEMHPILVTSK